MPQESRALPVRRVRADWKGPAATEQAGPMLPGEYRPLAPVPAASESGGGCSFTEAQLLKMLVAHYRWGYLAPDMLRRYNPFGRDIRALVEGDENA